MILILTTQQQVCHDFKWHSSRGETGQNSIFVTTVSREVKINSQLDIFRILKYIISSPPNLSRSVGVDTDH